MSEQAAPQLCMVHVRKVSHPAETQYRGEEHYTFGPCGRPLPCRDHSATLPDLRAVRALLSTSRNYHFADVLSAAWSLLREVESLRANEIAIRQLVGASDLCVHENEHGRCDWSRSAHEGINPSHAFVGESTLEALKRYVSDRERVRTEIKLRLDRIEPAIEILAAQRLTDEGRDKIVDALVRSFYVLESERVDVAALIDKYRGT